MKLLIHSQTSTVTSLNLGSIIVTGHPVKYAHSLRFIRLCCALQRRHNELDGVSSHQPPHYLLSRLYGRRSKKTSKLRVTGLCAGNSPVPGEFPARMASDAQNVSIWWRHHGLLSLDFTHITQTYFIGTVLFLQLSMAHWSDPGEFG